MLEVKKVAANMNLSEFNRRFIKEHQGFQDTKTGKTHYCPSDLGFKFTIDDCVKTNCSECWEKAQRTLKLKENLVIGGRNNNGK